MGSWLKAITKATGLDVVAKPIADAWDDATGNDNHQTTIERLPFIGGTSDGDTKSSDALGEYEDTGNVWVDTAQSTQDTFTETVEEIKTDIGESKVIDTVIDAVMPTPLKKSTQEAVKYVSDTFSNGAKAITEMGSGAADAIKKYGPYVLAGGAALIVLKFLPKN